MFDRQAQRDSFKQRVREFIPKNATSWRMNFVDKQPWIDGALGYRVDHKPGEGKVVDINDDAIVVRTARTTFWFLDRTLLTKQPNLGDSVRITPYARRGFDGRFAYQGKLEDYGNGATATVYQFGGNSTKLPVSKPACEYLQHLIEQMNEMMISDRFRNVAQLLADSEAKDFRIVDPDLDAPQAPNPEISFSVATSQFTGRVAVIYMVGQDVYNLRFVSADGTQELLDDIYFDMVPTVLESRLDDGSWRQIKLEVTKQAVKARTPRLAA